jgi:hypothetical protein
MDRQDIVYIEWIDPHSVDEWTDKDNEMLTSMQNVITVGRLVRETSSYVVIALNWCPDTENVSCSMHIPRVCIKKMEHIKP